MLEAAGLECERGGRRLFRGLTFALGGGELLRVSGPNGSGKTSLLRILCGLLAPGGGEVRWLGSPINSLKEEFSKQLVYLGHAPAVKDDLTAAENLSISCVVAGLRADGKKLQAALEAFGLPEAGLPVRKLSQGQRRRAALARLVVSESVPLWLLDEPFSALDAAATRLTEALILGQVGRGGAVVYTTHQAVGLPETRVIELDA